MVKNHDFLLNENGKGGVFANNTRFIMKHVVFCLEKVKQEIKIMKGKRTMENRMGKMLSNVGKMQKKL